MLMTPLFAALRQSPSQRVAACCLPATMTSTVFCGIPFVESASAFLRAMTTVLAASVSLMMEWLFAPVVGTVS